jgi:hypothetical protein
MSLPIKIKHTLRAVFRLVKIFIVLPTNALLLVHENLVTQRAVVSKIKTDILLVHENLVTQRAAVSKIKTDILLVAYQCTV